MVKTATRAIDLEPIDRLEEKLRLLVGMVERLKAEQAAAALRLTAQDLEGLKLIDDIVAEPEGGAHENPDETASNLREHLRRRLDQLTVMSQEQLVTHRYDKFRQMGNFFA